MSNPETTDDDARATREFALFNILVGHCGSVLTPAVVDKIRDEMNIEMSTGACAWAFQRTKVKEL